MALQEINWGLGMAGSDKIGGGLADLLNRTGITPKGQYQQRLADLIDQGNYGGAAGAAFGRGDTQTGGWLSRLAQEAKDSDYRRQRDTVTDGRWQQNFDADQNYRQQSLGMQSRSQALDAQRLQQQQDFQNRSLGLQERSFEQGRVPSGYRATEAGQEPIPGGPSDPKATLANRKASAEAIGLQPGTPTYNRYMLTGEVGNAEGGYGTTPIYGTDATGKPAILQLGKDGQPIQTPLNGFNIARDPLRLDTETGTAILDPQTRQQVGFVPKDVAGAARQKEVGKAQGEAQAGLPAGRQTAALVTQQIADLQADPYLKNMVGPVNSRLPNMSGDAARVQARIDQLQGGAFLQARQMLKGGGQITDYEGRKAESAMVRMNQAQNIGDFNAALDDFNSAVTDGVAKLEAQAGGGERSGQQQGAVPSQAVDALRQNPALRDQFDAKYGPGAAARALSQ